MSLQARAYATALTREMCRGDGVDKVSGEVGEIGGVCNGAKSSAGGGSCGGMRTEATDVRGFTLVDRKVILLETQSTNGL